MTHRQRILVLGGGPAGVTVAIGLRRLGHEVGLISEARTFAAVEGISERVVQGLAHAGLASVVKQLPPPTPRRVSWNGVASAANTERLIKRPDFDRALLHDAQAHGVRVMHGRITGFTPLGTGFTVSAVLQGEQRRIETDFIVEARGRAAPANALQRLRGAETVSLLQYRQGAPAAAHSAVQSFADGWAWMAATADGRRYLQLTFDVASARFPPKRLLAAFCTRRLMRLESARPFVDGSAPCGTLHARTSTPVLCHDVVGDNWIRVGDAAMAVDPLSGNGIFQALSSALQAHAVINTLLLRPQHAPLAKRFHEQRIAGLFDRFARIGRDFYVQESRWPDAAFWATRRGWPDAVPLHTPPTPHEVTLRRMPVVSDGFIEEAEVVVTPDQPLGVWHLQGQAMAPWLRALRAMSTDSLEQMLEGGVAGRDAYTVELARWMRQQGWI